MITVVGSLNMDLNARVARLPNPGETLLATGFLRTPGAKGGNQAVAASRAGSSVAFVGRVGNDDFGTELIASLQNTGVLVDHIAVDNELPTGLALIAVDDAGENSIVVIPGANSGVNLLQVDAVSDVITGCDLLLLQLELPLEAVNHAAQLAHDAGVRVILNPSPPQAFDPALLQLVNILVLNEREAAAISGIGFPVEPTYGARLLLGANVEAVVVTLGEEGCVVVTAHDEIEIPAYPVKVIDSTGAGDAFLGNLARALESGKSLADAARFATAAAAWCVRIPGAQPSMPTIQQTESLIEEYAL